MKIIRHGDVLIVPVELAGKLSLDIPSSKGEPAKDLILAYGEVTGHAHRITAGVATLERFENGDARLSVTEAATLSHEEHAAVVIPAGDYVIKLQREYTPEGWAYVRD